MKIIRRVVGGLMVLGFVSVQSLSSAEGYSFPGANCVSDHAADSFVSFGNLYNTFAGTNANFACPMVRRAPDTSTITGITVVVDDGGVVSLNNDGNVCCTARSCDQNGGNCSISPSVCSSGTGVQPLSIANVAGRSSGYAYIRCNPGNASKGQSGVTSYRWDD